MQQDILLYSRPEKFATPRAELQCKKPAKELVLDAKQGVTVKEKALDLQFSIASELELMQAMRRRALAFDLVGCCSYDSTNRWPPKLNFLNPIIPLQGTYTQALLGWPGSLKLC